MPIIYKGNERVCNDCLETKPFSQFGTRKTAIGTIRPQSYCKVCLSKRARQYQIENKETYNKYQREYQYRKRINNK